ncbi:AAA family ATPase [Oscillatoria sp. CS-180]|uniref:AAA family ATPase n=1 Tax=Oscillatoria sp. CS-180 TaxID=3021720 RepID=UPI00232A8D2F|nr:AAA family ATPase [Oscillatoria sp. CS-180]MDB9529556.1 AAA family ATPase [Oscillatoria sp. CS-180]
MPKVKTSCGPRDKLLRLEQELNQIFLERADLIRIILLSLLTCQHCLIFGKPGAAKSSLVRAIASAISGGCFQVQLGKDTTTDQLFGPIRVSELPNDRLCRAFENFMPGKPLAFLDEIDKANSVILNALYTAMEERLFLNDGEMCDMPLISLFGAANSISQLQTEALAPLLDRFLFRIEVDWMQSDSNFLEFVRRRATGDSPFITTVLSITELQQMQAAASNTDFPPDMQEAIARLRKELAVEDIHASDRRWGSCVDLLQATAFLNGNSAVTGADFAVLKHVLWTDKKQILVIERTLKPLLKLRPLKAKSQFKQALDPVIDRATQAMQNFDIDTAIGQAAIALTDLQGLKDGLAQVPQTQEICQALTVIDQKITQLETHRQMITH